MSDDVSSEVDQLLKDREKYESWLGRLEARKGEASSRAYERVRGDYQQRLDDVLRRLKGHSESISGKLADLAQQKARLEKERSGRTEELDEARLRHLVGEYGDDRDWQELEGRLQGALKETETRIDELQGEVLRLEEIIGLVERPVEKPARPTHVETPAEPTRIEEPPAAKQVESQEQREPARTVEERPVTATLPPEIIEAAEEESSDAEAAVESVSAEPPIEETPPAEPMPEPPRREPPRARQPEVAEAGAGRGDEGYLSLGDLVLEDSDLDEVLSERAQVQPEKRTEPESSAVPEEAKEGADEGAEEGAEVGDELAFLESLSLGADEESEGFSFLEQRGSGTPQTIICPHCSAANDPAEWYCTECGEELPAE
ncbi:MAG: hypothetical protein PVI01_11205 [Gemmatimonadales bacterium]|jgi:hypothetical protein